MLAYSVFIALLISIWVISQKGIETAFLKVWIPFFLLFPFSFWVNIPGLPDPNFMQAAILPILVVLLRQQLQLGKVRFGKMEFLLLVYCLIKVFNDFLGRGYSDAQNYAFYMISALIGPYVLGSYLITSRRMDIETSKMFVLVMLFMFPMFLYEAKFWVNPIFKIFSGFFPNSFSGLSIRWGLARTAGTFEHPILACIIVLAVYRLHRWLTWIGEWNKPQTGLLGKIQEQLKRFPFSFSQSITIVLVLMALMTISRGPWIGGVAGALIVMVGNTKNRKKMLIRIVLLMFLAVLIGQQALNAYLTPKVGAVLSEEAQTMLYRKVMIDQYMEFFYEKIWTGWGLTKVPKIPGMESVDNAFFLMGLQHGILAPIVFLTIIFYAIISQIRFGLSAPQNTSPIGFTFAGIYLMCLIAFATVYMGAQTEPLIFLLLGWGEAIKQRGQDEGNQTGEKNNLETVNAEYRRVMV